jgi:translation initiation factor IF-1
MSVAHVEALVEEASAEAALSVLLPQLIGTATFRIYAHTGKHDLLRKLPQRLRTYRRIVQPDWLVLVLVDADTNDCRVLKRQLDECATDAGLTTRGYGSGQFSVLNRIAIEELEAWYFGDWEAVRRAYPDVPITIPSRAAFRNPDAIAGGTWEAFERVMQTAGYFPGGLGKVEAAHSIAPHMDPVRNISRSFQIFRDALLEVARQ